MTTANLRIAGQGKAATWQRSEPTQGIAKRTEDSSASMSGYAEDSIVHHGVLDAGIEFLQKPIAPVTLLHRVREVLQKH